MRFIFLFVVLCFLYSCSPAVVDVTGTSSMPVFLGNRITPTKLASQLVLTDAKELSASDHYSKVSVSSTSGNTRTTTTYTARRTELENTVNDLTETGLILADGHAYVDVAYVYGGLERTATFSFRSYKPRLRK